MQIRKNLKRIIADYTEWELIEVSTDYCETENQEETCKNFLRILTMIKLGYIDVLFIYLGNDSKRLLTTANTIYLYWKRFEVDLYVSSNGQLLSSESDEKLIVSR